MSLAGFLAVLALAAGPAATAASRARASHSHLPSGLSPQQLHAAYELPSATSVSSAQTIAVIELGGDPTIESDLAVYDKRYGLASCTRANGCLRVVNQEGGAAPLPVDSFRAGETAIDVEGAHAICQNCHLLVVEGNPASADWVGEIGAEVNTAIRAGATEVSICIELYGAGTEAEETALLTRANEADFDHPGVVMTVASGDCGYDEANDPERWSFCEHVRWRYPSFPAKSPTVVGVGGTSLSERGGVWTSAVWEQGGSGCSSIFAAPAWQTSVAGWGPTGCGGRRLDVDVAAVASPRTGPAIYNTTPAGDWSQAGWGRAGGTSVAAPIVAAEFALAGGAHGVAYPGQTLYSHAGDGTAFEDVTEGTNGSCGASTICNATIGYDGPSGLGSPIGLRAFSLPGAPVETAAPSISGRPTRGHLLTAHTGRWSGKPTWFGYQWETCNRSGTGCMPIQGASGARYRPTASDANRPVRLMVSAGNSSGFGAPGFALPTAAVRGATRRARRH
jgi:subtilase family serine protease